MEQAIVFVSGGNRGIGLGMVQLLLEKGHTVIAGYRSEASAQSLFAAANDRLHPFKIDVTDESDCADLHDFIADSFGRLDMLINNAGILIDRNRPLNELDFTDLSITFNVNVGGVHLVTKSLYPLLVQGRGKRIINISSTMASIAQNNGGTVAYRVSKTALNMLTSNQAIAYQADGVTAVCVHPGWVQSDMGGPNARLTVSESAAHLVTLITTLTPAQTGRFFHYDGTELPW